MNNAMAIILGLLGSSALFTFLQFLIIRNDNKKKEKQGLLKETKCQLDKIQVEMNELRKDTVRTQLMLLMTDYPHQVEEIMSLAECYFSSLKGNWYCSKLFTEWLESQKLEKPMWFKH